MTNGLFNLSHRFPIGSCILITGSFYGHRFISSFHNTKYERDRIPKTVIDELARQIADKFQPQRIILFGSYAWGTPQPESDVDLLVVMENSLREAEQALQIYQKIDYLFGLDLLVISPKRLNERLKWGNSFLHAILKRGKVLYESPNPRVD